MMKTLPACILYSCDEELIGRLDQNFIHYCRSALH